MSDLFSGRTCMEGLKGTSNELGPNSWTTHITILCESALQYPLEENNFSV